MQQSRRFAATLWLVGPCLFALAVTAAEQRAAGIKPRASVAVKQAPPPNLPEVAAPGKGSVTPTPMKRPSVPSPLPTLPRDGKAPKIDAGPQHEAPATLALPPTTGIPSQRKVETFGLKPGGQGFRQSIRGAFGPEGGAYDILGRQTGYEEVIHNSDVPELNKWTKTERETTQYYDESSPSVGQHREQQNIYGEHGRTIEVHEEVWGSKDADKKTSITTYHTYNSLGQVAQELTYNHETGEVTDAGALRAQISALSDGDYDSTSTAWSGLRLLIRAINAKTDSDAYAQLGHGSDLDATSTVYQPHRKLPTDLAKGVAARDVTATASSGAYAQLGHGKSKDATGSDGDATSTVYRPGLRRVGTIKAKPGSGAYAQLGHGSDLDATSTVYRPGLRLVDAKPGSGTYAQLGHGSDADATSTVFQPGRAVLPKNLANGDSDLNALITATRSDTKYRSDGRTYTYRDEINSDADETVAASQRLGTEYRETIFITDTDEDPAGHLIGFEFHDRNGNRHSVDGITYDEDGNASGFTFTHKQQGTITSITYPRDDDD